MRVIKLFLLAIYLMDNCLNFTLFVNTSVWQHLKKTIRVYAIRFDDYALFLKVAKGLLEKGRSQEGFA